MGKDDIKKLALLFGFKLKPLDDGSTDLHPYVYLFADAVYNSGFSVGYCEAIKDVDERESIND